MARGSGCNDLRPGRARPSGRDEHGQVLAMVLVVGAVLLIVLVAFGQSFTQQVRGTRRQLEDAQAQYVAEAGLARTIGFLQQQSNWASAALPSPNPMTLADSSNQVLITYQSQSAGQIAVSAYGYILARGYNLPAASAPVATKVRAQALIQATLKQVASAGSSIWNYAAASNGAMAVKGMIHGSVYNGSGDFTVESIGGVLNDYTFVAANTPAWLQVYLNTLSASTLKARAEAFAGDIKVKPNSYLGTVAHPLSAVGVNQGHSINVAANYASTETAVAALTFPDIAATQMNGALDAAGEYDYRLVAAGTGANNGCVRDTNAVTDGKAPLTLDTNGFLCLAAGATGNGIQWFPATASLIVNGTNFVDGDLTIGDNSLPDITYLGRGMIVVNGDVKVISGLHPAVMANFPATALLEVFTPYNLTLNPPTRNNTPLSVIAGAFAAGKNMTVSQAIVVGATILNADNINFATTSVQYQVPSLAANLVTGTPASSATTSFTVGVSNWRLYKQ